MHENNAASVFFSLTLNSNLPTHTTDLNRFPPDAFSYTCEECSLFTFSFFSCCRLCQCRYFNFEQICQLGSIKFLKRKSLVFHIFSNMDNMVKMMGSNLLFFRIRENAEEEMLFWFRFFSFVFLHLTNDFHVWVNFVPLRVFCKPAGYFIPLW